MVVIILMATDTGGRSVVIIPVMAEVTIGDIGMCPRQCPVIVMGWHQGRAPTGVCGMTACTIG